MIRTTVLRACVMSLLLGTAASAADKWAALKAGGRLVANAVSLESEAKLIDLSQAFGGDLTRLSVARAERLGEVTMWQPAKPITQWRVQKP